MLLLLLWSLLFPVGGGDGAVVAAFVIVIAIAVVVLAVIAAPWALYVLRFETLMTYNERPHAAVCNACSFVSVASVAAVTRSSQLHATGATTGDCREGRSGGCRRRRFGCYFRGA